jgi:hypothetical protein
VSTSKKYFILTDKSGSCLDLNKAQFSSSQKNSFAVQIETNSDCDMLSALSKTISTRPNISSFSKNMGIEAASFAPLLTNKASHFWFLPFPKFSGT